jgi:hypothetical protein
MNKKENALKRNWCKFLLKGMFCQLRNMEKSSVLSIAEKGRLENTARILEAILNDWKPTLGVK